jgi:hypothetical protein
MSVLRSTVQRVASKALALWRTERTRHLDELLGAHRLVGGTGRGRRWRTSALNEALVLRLAAEFQGFARDLHGAMPLTVS